MNSEQFRFVLERAKHGVAAASEGDEPMRRMWSDMLHGWWACAMSFDDFDLADTAYRGAALIKAAAAFRNGEAYTVRLDDVCMYGRAT